MTTREEAEQSAVFSITGKMLGGNPSAIVAYKAIAEVAANASSDVWEGHLYRIYGVAANPEGDPAEQVKIILSICEEILDDVHDPA